MHRLAQTASQNGLRLRVEYVGECKDLMILGLPFLVHDNIIVNAFARTVIDKNSNFDLLNPIPPTPLKAVKQKLKDFFRDLQ